jgi:hypothetical protein
MGRARPRLAGSAALFLACALSAHPGAAQRSETPTVAVPPTIVAEPASQTSLTITVGPAGRLPANSFVRVRGLPSSVSLTEGHAIAPGSWAIPLVGLANLKAIVPAGVSGRSEIIVQLIGVDGTMFAESRAALVVGPSTIVAPPPPAEKKAAAAAPSPPPAATPPPAPAAVRADRARPRAPQLPPEEQQRAERMVAQGDRHLEQGNIGAARLFFQRAAEAGLALAAIRLAATYDPSELARLHAQGVRPDREEARRWYEKARELGAPEAEERLARLGGR